MKRQDLPSNCEAKMKSNVKGALQPSSELLAYLDSVPAFSSADRIALRDAGDALRADKSFEAESNTAAERQCDGRN